MALQAHRRLMLVLALAASAFLLGEALTGIHVGLLYLAPALLVAVPLLFGRFAGERSLMRLLARRRPRIPRRAAVRQGRAVPAPHLVLLASALLALCRAERPPPLVPAE